MNHTCKHAEPLPVTRDRKRIEQETGWIGLTAAPPGRKNPVHQFPT
jgi:hypothetical protein